MRNGLKQAVATIASASVSTRDRYLQQTALMQERDRLLATIAAAMPDNPVLAGHKVYCQCDEDGIIAEIFARIGTAGRTFVEFGCGDGRENNTHALLLNGWRGLWVDGNPDNAAFIRKALSKGGDEARLLLYEGYVTLDNVEAIYERATDAFCSDGGRIDLLSMDLDGNDLHFLDRLERYRPRVICAEYNALLGPDIAASVEYDAAHAWKGDDYMGCSLAALVALLHARDYRLVSCNLGGSNAFFVESRLAGLFGEYPPARLFQPARYHLIYLQDYNPRSLRFLAGATRYRDFS